MEPFSAASEDHLYLIAGLGNPGRKYEKTRHNVGFDVLEELLRRFPGANLQSKFDGRFTKLSYNDKKIVLLWPETFMNESGRSISAAAKFFKVGLERTLVICDDLSLPWAKSDCEKADPVAVRRACRMRLSILEVRSFLA